MNSISTCFSNEMISARLFSSILNGPKEQMDKFTKSVMVTTVAIIAFSLLTQLFAYCYKILKPKLTPINVILNGRNALNRNVFTSTPNISLSTVRLTGNLLDSLSLHSLTPQELIEYLKACPNVKNLTLANISITKSVLENLPKQVTNLHLAKCNLSQMSLEDIPKCFKAGTLTFAICDMTNVTLNVLDVFENIELHSCSNVKFIPISLKNLKMDVGHNTPLVFFGKLDSLTICISSYLSLSDLPPQLGSLSLVMCTDILNLKHLPPDLKKLSVCGSTLVDRSLDKLPAALETLEIETDLQGFSLDKLPSSLQNLKISCKSIPSLDHLPAGLKTLELNGCHLRGISLDNLPDNLISVKFVDCEGVSLSNPPAKLKNKIHVDSHDCIL